jgi:hypothetical protein
MKRLHLAQHGEGGVAALGKTAKKHFAIQGNALIGAESPSRAEQVNAGGRCGAGVQIKLGIG